MRLSTFFKKLPVPAILVGGLVAGFTGDIPIIGPTIESLLSKLDLLVFEETKHPFVFLVFSGLTIGWVIYTVTSIFIYERKERALIRLGKAWEDGTDFRNDAATRRVLTESDFKKIKRLEDIIFKNVAIVSKPELSRFRKLGIYDATKHPNNVQEIMRGDQYLIILSERLLRVDEFIKKHAKAE